MQVWIVEADEIERLGQVAALLATEPGLDVHSCSPEQARRFVDQDDLPNPGSVVITGIRRVGGDFDRYPSIRTIERLRRVRESGSRVVGIVHGPCNPLVCVRLARAGLEEIVDPLVARTGEQLLDLVLTRQTGQTVEPNPYDLACLGVTGRTDPEGALRYVRDNAMEAAFRPGLGQADTGLSRRNIIRVRGDIGEIAGLAPEVHRATGGAWRPSDLPTWRSVVGYVNVARGAERASAAAEDECSHLVGAP